MAQDAFYGIIGVNKCPKLSFVLILGTIKGLESLKLNSINISKLLHKVVLDPVLSIELKRESNLISIRIRIIY